MKRLLAIAAVAAAALSATGADALTAEQSYSLGFGYSAPGPIGASGMLFTSVDRLTGTVTQAFGTICSYNGFSSCESGAWVIDADPIGQTATISQTLGTMTVNLSFLATHVNTNVPYFDVELNPDTQAATLYGNFGRQGRMNGTVTAPNGTVTVVSGFASMGVNLNAAAP